MAFSGLAVQGDYLMVSHSNGIKMFYTPDGESGAWLTSDVAVAATEFADDEDVTYFVGASGPIGDTTFGVFRFAPRAGGSDRGKYASGDPAEVRVQSRSLGPDDHHTKVPWHRVGARVSSVAGSSPTAEVKIITGTPSHPGEEGPSVPKTMSGVDDVYAQSPGPATEAFAQVDVEGDARVESVTVFWHGGAAVR